MVIQAKFPSRCSLCGRKIAVGEQVEWARGERARHLHCQPRAVPQNWPRQWTPDPSQEVHGGKTWGQVQEENEWFDGEEVIAERAYKQWRAGEYS